MQKPKSVTKCIVDCIEDVVIKVNTNGGISHTLTEVFGVGMVKPCGHCKEVKPVADFHKDKKSSVGLATRCKDCACRRSRQCHADRMKDPVWLDKRRQLGRDLGRDRKRMAVEYKGDVCNDCGVTYPDYVYDFHHLDGDTKTDNPSAILKRSWDKALEELDLCVLLCANCHRERHFGQT